MPGLEEALDTIEASSASSLKAASSVVKLLRKLNTAAKTGNLRELRSALQAADKAIAVLRQQFANTRDSWNFDEEQYLASGQYSAEVVAIARRMGVNVVERDDRLFCYPVLVKVSPSEGAVLIDKKRENRIRPTMLATRLADMQKKPPPFKPEAFLECLFTAYIKVVAMRRKDVVQIDPVIPLIEIYELLTLLPGQTREYTKQEFARDLYVLHNSGIETTKTGARVDFPASTGTKLPSRMISIITSSGDEKRYYGVRFTGSAGKKGL